MKSQKEFFNSMASSWDVKCNHDMNKVEYILDLLEIKKGDKILDVGTGTGVLVPILSKKVGLSGNVKAIDIADKMIEVAQKKYNYDNVEFVCDDVLKIKEDKNEHDHIICYSMFPHFQNKEQAVKLLASKLSNGGKLVICHSQSREAINNLHKSKGEAVKEDNLPDFTVIKQYYHKAGLDIVKKIDTEQMFVVIGIK
ncbi:methyltransferase domain-containing protein [Proteinivorax tanatarense]|uniref:Methyltransferase domain-containing protein n=1 Tax=Proteinivorax tanatarense TaxID=1260629 RepID=A0AAU7VK61_9FIRM